LRDAGLGVRVQTLEDDLRAVGQSVANEKYPSPAAFADAAHDLVTVGEAHAGMIESGLD